MNAWGAPAWTEYSSEEFTYRATGSRLLLIKDKIRPNILRTGCPTLSKVLDISSATARLAV